MKSLTLFVLLSVFIYSINGKINSSDNKIFSHVNIYSNLAEIIEPLGKLPLEFSNEEWSYIRPDTLTLIGPNVNVTEQIITEKKTSLNNQKIYIRSPTSTNTNIKYIKGVMIDEDRNLVQFTDNFIGTEPIYLTVSPDQILHILPPPESKYYVNFKFNSKDNVYTSYLRSNLNWKTCYQLNLFEESIDPILIVMANIRNDGKTKLNIKHANLLGGDINLQMPRPYVPRPPVHKYAVVENLQFEAETFNLIRPPPPSIEEGKEFAGLYTFSINQSFAIDGKTDYMLPMFRPSVTIERIKRFSKQSFSGIGKRTDKAERTYRLQSDKFLSRGNCMIRENDQLIGEISLPDLAANNIYDFSIGKDSDIISKENITLISTHTYNETLSNSKVEERTQTIYNINISFKNFKKFRPVNIEYEQVISTRSVKLIKSIGDVKLNVSTIEHKSILSPLEEKFISYTIETVE
ncbi:unnamed protein product [Adineta steineri]|uniref:DUF4139 domain-containing protein n=1 Tax=Adineta steineri TaxID=433720 RepID=A0A814VHH6_9BILA|nr:unnamed protein product [Adineta steineri]